MRIRIETNSDPKRWEKGKKFPFLAVTFRLNGPIFCVFEIYIRSLQKAEGLFLQPDRTGTGVPVPHGFSNFCSFFAVIGRDFSFPILIRIHYLKEVPKMSTETLSRKGAIQMWPF
jgi:hypothetical protein